LELLSLNNENARDNFIEERKNTNIVVANFITCMSTLKKNNPDDLMSVSELIVGTESGYIYVVEHSGSKIINKFKLNHIPYQVTTLGAYDVDYRIHIAARNNCIYTIKNGEVIYNLI
jgi:Bardet-Biedl syndrome 1 protein